MRSPLSQSQLGVYYACVNNKDEKVNYQNALLVALPPVIDLDRFRKAVYDTLCAHPYLASHVVLDDDGMPQMESGMFPAMEETVKALNEAPFRDRIKIMVGGAPITQEFADKIGADCYTEDAAAAAEAAKKIMGK